MKFRFPGIAHMVGVSRLVLRDQLRRQAVEANEADRTLYKAMTSDQSLPYSIRQQVQRLFDTELPRDSAPHRVRNRCALTGRPRGVYRWCRLSRLMFRKLASHGNLPGVTKASW
jgi:small subunit ribosomal protein S14